MVWGLVRRPSVICVASTSELIRRISFKLQLLFAPGHIIRLDVFEFLEKSSFFSQFFMFFFFFSLSLTSDPMGEKMSKFYSSLKSIFFFKLILNFLLIRPHKSTVFDLLKFNFLSLRFCHDVFFFDAMGGIISKRYSSHK